MQDLDFRNVSFTYIAYMHGLLQLLMLSNKKIGKSNRKPNKIQGDKNRKFSNTSMRSWLEQIKVAKQAKLPITTFFCKKFCLKKADGHSSCDF